MITAADKWIVLEGAATTFILEIDERGPQVIYWNSKLEDCSPDVVKALLARPVGHASPPFEVPITLCSTQGSGFFGSPGISLSKGASGWDFNPSQIVAVDRHENGADIKTIDSVHEIELCHRFIMDPASDVIKLSTKVINRSDEALFLGGCAAATVPLPDYVDQLTSFTGRWANEFQRQTIDQFNGVYARENRRGRTSHDNFPGLLVHAKSATETAGDVFGFHLGWSGNHRVVSEKLSDGRAFVQMGELLLPGEIILGRDEVYETPALYCAHSATGFSGLSQKFHRYVRGHFLPESVKAKPRPVHYNTWEAVYFDHDIEKLKELAGKAAGLGVERFVLDDGWFKGRRSDSAGLGDWFVDEDIYPNGLTPLIAHVKAQGMEFGLWVEPEMVNSESDLYRDHPDWVLSATTSEQIPFRNQLALDLSKAEVTDYLFGRLDALLSENDIAYLKWDMNRDIHHPGSSGRPSVHAHVKALYGLLEKLRARHPKVEIESCASGGGRADYGVLEHTDRIWTSDSNDAIDRLSIQRGCSFFFPSEVMGAHIGPRVCHITGRILSAEFRAATAMFGHMGMEFDLTELTGEEAEAVKAAVELHKRHRQLIHTGELVRLETPACASAFAIVAADRNKAIASYSQVSTRIDTVPETLRFVALDPSAHYQVNVVWPIEPFGKSTEAMDFSGVFSGDVLMKVGVQLSIMLPETNLTFYLTKCD